MEELLKEAHQAGKLGEAGSRGIIKAGQTVLARLTEGTDSVPVVPHWIGWRRFQQRSEGTCESFHP